VDFPKTEEPGENFSVVRFSWGQVLCSCD